MPPTDPFLELLQRDPRYKREAYDFVRQSLAFAQQVLGLGGMAASQVADLGPDDEPPVEPHLTGQQLCDAIRRFALDQFGLLAKFVLNSWGLHTTGDFGEIVYNLISIGEMKKSEADRREDFDDVYDFEQAFRKDFRLSRREYPRGGRAEREK